jgi:hypothetical protein
MWGKYVWDKEFQVPTFTLDQLIGRYGVPDFCKIDVEGAELLVLQGLSTPIPCLSFEYLTIEKERSLSCIERLAELAQYEYNWTLSESSTLQSAQWLTAAEMKAALLHLKDGTYSGDIYAKIVEPHRPATPPTPTPPPPATPPAP